MRLVYFAAAFLPSKSAQGVHVMRMCAALARSGLSVTLCAFHRKSSDNILGKSVWEFYGMPDTFEIRLFKCPIGRGAEMLLGIYAIRILAWFPRSEVLLYSRVPYVSLIGVTLGYTVIYESHSPPENKVRIMVERKLVKSTGLKRFVVISNALKRLYLKGPVCASMSADIVVAPDAAEPVVSSEKNGQALKLPRGYQLHVGYAGHLFKGRGIPIITTVARRTPQYFYHIIGGDDEDVAHWRRKAANNVCFYGFVSPARIQSYLAQFDVLIIPYEEKVYLKGERINTATWMSPMKIFEYMAAGKAIVASDLPVFREVLEDGVDAMLVPACDTERWVEALNLLVAGEERARLGYMAHNKFIRYHTWDRRVDTVLSGLVSAENHRNENIQ